MEPLCNHKKYDATCPECTNSIGLDLTTVKDLRTQFESCVKLLQERCPHSDVEWCIPRNERSAELTCKRCEFVLESC